MGGVFKKPVQTAQQMDVVKEVPKPATTPQPVTPTTAEVSQSEATAADGTGAMSRKVKRKGRSATILTSSSGVDQSVTLGTQSLLGG
jgi:hypothetical protein